MHGTCGNVPNFPTVVRHSWPFQRRSTVFINKTHTKKTLKLVAKIFANKSGLFVPDFTFLNLGLCAACWARSMCHHELWPISVSHPYSFLNSSLGVDRAKHYHKITIPILRLFLKFCCSRLISLYSALSLLFLLTLFWLGCYCSMWLYFSPGLVKVL